MMTNFGIYSKHIGSSDERVPAFDGSADNWGTRSMRINLRQNSELRNLIEYTFRNTII